jgi:quinol monooxygenase YgiN
MKTKSFILPVCVVIFMLCFGTAGARAGVPVTDSKGKTQVTENSMMITAKILVKADKVKEFIEAAKEMIEKANKESGCKFYQLYQDPYNNTRFMFVEEYKNQAAVDAHFATDYFKAFGAKIGPLVQEPAKIKIVTVAKEVNQ